MNQRAEIVLSDYSSLYPFSRYESPIRTILRPDRTSIGYVRLVHVFTRSRIPLLTNRSLLFFYLLLLQSACCMHDTRMRKTFILKSLKFILNRVSTLSQADYDTFLFAARRPRIEYICPIIFDTIIRIISEIMCSLFFKKLKTLHQARKHRVTRIDVKKKRNTSMIR